MMRPWLSTFAVSTALLAQTTDSLTGTRITPPTVASIAPRGLARGTTTELTVEGFNLANATKVYFSKPGLTAKILRIKELPDLPDIRLGSNGTPSTIDLGPLPARNQVTMEVKVDGDVPAGPVSFRLLTPLGTSPSGTIAVEPFYGEALDREPNDSIDTASDVYLPAVLTGTINNPGDTDVFKLKITQPNRTLVFQNSFAAIGSTLTPLVTVLNSDGEELARYGNDGQNREQFVHQFKEPGTYYLRVTDYLNTGRGSNQYRLKVGDFAVVSSVYPLGVPRGKQAAVTLTGTNLKQPQLTVLGEPAKDRIDRLVLRPEGKNGAAFNEVELAVGDGPEAEASGTNTTVTAAQRLTLPVTINGRLDKPKTDHYYRFAARKGEQVVVEVNARRLGSELDSLIEVLDHTGKPIERAVARPVSEHFTTLNDRDSAQNGLRINEWKGWSVGDYIMAGNEIIRVRELPKGPDEDVFFEAFLGQRLTYYDTTGEAHAMDSPVYKVQFLPPGSQPTPNGLPLMRLYYRNDDGGPGFSKDSRMTFTAPADGEYVVRLRDVRGLGGEKFAYRLAVRPPQGDFRLTSALRNMNVPAGGAIPVEVRAMRLDGFDGPIEVELRGLPAGLTASKGVVAPGQSSTILLIGASDTAKLEDAVPYSLVGSATVNGKRLERPADPEDHLKLLAVMPKADVTIHTESRTLTLEPGGTVEFKVKISRNNGFGGRVPLQVRNLPPRVMVPDVGLNGVLINEDETERTVKIEALPNAEPIEQTIYVNSVVETRSPQQNLFAAPETIKLIVKPRTQISSR